LDGLKEELEVKNTQLQEFEKKVKELESKCVIQ